MSFDKAPIRRFNETGGKQRLNGNTGQNKEIPPLGAYNPRFDALCKSSGQPTVGKSARFSKVQKTHEEFIIPKSPFHHRCAALRGHPKRSHSTLEINSHIKFNTALVVGRGEYASSEPGQDRAGSSMSVCSDTSSTAGGTHAEVTRLTGLVEDLEKEKELLDADIMRLENLLGEMEEEKKQYELNFNSHNSAYEENIKHTHDLMEKVAHLSSEIEQLREQKDISDSKILQLGKELAVINENNKQLEIQLISKNSEHEENAKEQENDTMEKAAHFTSQIEQLSKEKEISDSKIFKLDQELALMNEHNKQLESKLNFQYSEYEERAKKQECDTIEKVEHFASQIEQLRKEKENSDSKIFKLGQELAQMNEHNKQLESKLNFQYSEYEERAKKHECDTIEKVEHLASQIEQLRKEKEISDSEIFKLGQELEVVDEDKKKLEIKLIFQNSEHEEKVKKQECDTVEKMENFASQIEQLRKEKETSACENFKLGQQLAVIEEHNKQLENKLIALNTEHEDKSKKQEHDTMEKVAYFASQIEQLRKEKEIENLQLCKELALMDEQNKQLEIKFISQNLEHEEKTKKQENVTMEREAHLTSLIEQLKVEKETSDSENLKLGKEWTVMDALNKQLESKLISQNIEHEEKSKKQEFDTMEKVAHLTSVNQQLKEEKEASDSENFKLSKELTLLAGENKQLESKLISQNLDYEENSKKLEYDTMEKVAHYASQIEQLRNEKEISDSEILKLSKELAVIVEQNTELEFKLISQNLEHEEKTKLQECDSIEKATYFTSQMEQLRKEKEISDSENRNLCKELALMDENNKQLEVNLTSQNLEYEEKAKKQEYDIMEKLANVTSLIEQLKEEKEATESENIKLGEELAVMDRNNKQLEIKLIFQNTEHEEKSKKQESDTMEKMRHFTSQIGQLKKEKETSDSEILKFCKELALMDEHNKQLEFMLISQNLEHEEKVKKKEYDIIEKVTYFTSQMEQLGKEKEIFHSENHKLGKELALLDEHNNQLENNLVSQNLEHEEKTKELKYDILRKVAHFTAEIEKLQMEKKTSDSQALKLGQELAVMDEQNKHLESKLIAQNLEHEENIEKLKSDLIPIATTIIENLDKMAMSKRSMQEKVEKNLSAYITAQKEHFQMHLNSAKTEVETLKTTISGLEVEKSSLGKRIRYLEGLIEPFKAQLIHYEDAVRLEKEGKEAAAGERESLREKYAEVLGHHNTKQKILHIMNLKDELEKSRKEAQKFRSETMLLRKQLIHYERDSFRRQPIGGKEDKSPGTNRSLLPSQSINQR